MKKKKAQVPKLSPEERALIQLSRALRRAVKVMGARNAATVVAAWFRRAGYPRELRRHL